MVRNLSFADMLDMSANATYKNEYKMVKRDILPGNYINQSEINKYCKKENRNLILYQFVVNYKNLCGWLHALNFKNFFDRAQIRLCNGMDTVNTVKGGAKLYKNIWSRWFEKKFNVTSTFKLLRCKLGLCKLVVDTILSFAILMTDSASVLCFHSHCPVQFKEICAHYNVCVRVPLLNCDMADERCFRSTQIVEWRNQLGIQLHVAFVNPLHQVKSSDLQQKSTCRHIKHCKVPKLTHCETFYHSLTCHLRGIVVSVPTNFACIELLFFTYTNSYQCTRVWKKSDCTVIEKDMPSERNNKRNVLVYCSFDRNDKFEPLNDKDNLTKLDRLNDYLLTEKTNTDQQLICCQDLRYRENTCDAYEVVCCTSFILYTSETLYCFCRSCCSMK